MPDPMRQSLAADLWRRYATDPGAQAPQPEPALRSGRDADGPCGEQEQTLLGLVLFGCHTYGQAAALIGVPAPSAAEHLRSVLRRSARGPSSRSA
ncbi:hypothetical protein ACFVW8_31360 [Streptomyces sp. NPDC058221]|uniref:hypothetical protein n=1 Tax=Streptomyces sp. NPDC058221 TaxID=3346388 RepID=UPI0036E174DD